MQMKNIKWDVHLAADGKRRFGSASGRCHLAGAAGSAVREAVGSANSKALSIASGRRGLAFRRTGFAAIAALILFAAAPPKARAGGAAALYPRIRAAIASGNATRTQWAANEIADLLREGDHYNCPSRLRWVWLPLLLRHQDYADIVRLTRLQSLLAPGDTANTWDFQMYRTQALLLMGHAKAALRNAKSLFNVVNTGNTAHVALLVYQCLLAQKSDGAELAREFRREQIAGSQPPRPGQPPKTCDVLAGITVHGKAYEEDVRRQVGVDVPALIARGNLWLLADHPNKALQCFKAAYGIATPGELAMVCDRIAAAMRAKDGTIGAADAWLKSLAR